MSNQSPKDLDWIKLPCYKSAWYTHHCNQLKYYLSRMEFVNGFILHTIRLSVVGPHGQFDTGDMQLNISPLCASVEERGLFLSRLHINQLGLTKVGERDTRNYGTVDVFSGVKLRIDAEKCKLITYEIPDGFVFETPDIFSSATMVSIQPTGIPERQGIVNREIFFRHGLLSSGGLLYALPHDLFQISEIPQFMSKYPICEVVVAGGIGGRGNRRVDMNASLRRMHDVQGVDGLHPSFTEDYFVTNDVISQLLRPLPITFCAATPRCFGCDKKTSTPIAKPEGDSTMKTSATRVELFYCPLCRTRHVQTPHVYCSKKCQMAHWTESHHGFHSHPHIEQQVLVTPVQDASITVFRSTYYERSIADTKVAEFLEKDILGTAEDEEGGTTLVLTNRFSYEVVIIGFISFYAVCWLILRIHTSDRHEHEDL